MSDQPSFAGYTLADLEKLCMERAAVQKDLDVESRYLRAATAALPFLLARMRQLERRPRRAGRQAT